MQSKYLSMRWIPLFLGLWMTLGMSHGDEGDQEDDREKMEITVDTCGWLAGHRVFVTTSTKHETYARTEGYEGTISIDLEILKREGKSVDTTSQTILQWPISEQGNGIDRPSPPIIKAEKNSLRFLEEDHLIADFIYQKGELRMTPAFRKNVIKDLEGDTTKYTPNYLLEILDGAGWPDHHFLQVLRLYPMRDSIRQGYVDGMIESLHAMAGQAADDTIARYCKRLSDSLVAAKKSMQPVKLAAAKRVGTILNDPIYPPLDSPTVFWKDSLLVVVQEEATGPRMMRAFDPATGKWGKKEKAKYPETAMSKIFKQDPGCYVRDEAPSNSDCWRTKLGKPKDDPCEGIECSPLIALDDTVDGGSLRNFSDLAKAGGSCAAGWGEYEFRAGGWVYPTGDDKVGWQIIPGTLLSGTRKYEFDLTRDYSVVVSPYQNWVAYALGSKDGKRKELWVARLKYANP